MFKKIIIILISIAFLTACGKKVKVDFKGPTSGPDPVKMQPTHGPNELTPIEDPIDGPIEGP